MSFDDITNSITQNEGDQRKSALTRSAVLSVDTDPDKHAQNRKASKDRGFPVQFANPAKKKTSADDLHSRLAAYHQLQESSPVTATHLSNPEVAKMADHENMSSFEKLTQTLQDYTEPIGHMIMSAPQSALEGFRGVAAVAGSMSAGQSFDQALLSGIESLEEKTLTRGLNPDLKTDTSKAVNKIISLPFDDWSEAGEWAVDHTPGGPTQKAFERTLWEFLPFTMGAKKSPREALAHQMAEGRKSASNAARIKMLTDSAKESELRKRDPQMHKDFVHDATAEMEPITVLTGQLDDIISRAGATHDEVLSDPVAYQEARLNGDEQLELPLDDVTALADHVTDEDIKKMKVGDTPSVDELAKKADEEDKSASVKMRITKADEAALKDMGYDQSAIDKMKPQEAADIIKEGKEPSDPQPRENQRGEEETQASIRPAVKVGDETYTGEDGQHHADIIKDNNLEGVTDDQHIFVDDDGNELDRGQAAAWLKENRPDLYEKLPEDQKEELHSEGLWKSQGIEPGKAETTGIKNRMVEEERQGQDAVDKLSIADKARHEEGRRLVDSGEYDPRTGAREIVANPRGFVTAEKQAALLYDKVRIKNEQRTVMDQLEKAIEADDQDAANQLKQRRDQLQEDYAANQQATTYAGTEASAALRIRIGEMRDDYSITHTMQRLRLAIGKVDPNTGKIEIPEEVRAKVEQLTKDLDTALSKLQEAEEKASRMEAQKLVVETQKQAAKTTQRTAKKATRAENRKALDTEFKGLTKQLAQLFKDQRGMAGPDINAGRMNPLDNPNAVKVLVEIAKNRIKAGFNTVDGMVDEVFNAVKDLVEGVTKRDVRDAISGYGKTGKMSQEEINVQLREVKRQARLISALEDATGGKVPERSGLQRDAVSDEVRELQKEVHQAMRESGIDSESGKTPEERWKTSLDAVKTRLKNHIHDLEDQIKTGKKTPKKIGIEYDEEAKSLQAHRDELKAIVEGMEGKSTLSPEQRIKIATNAVRKSIAELERRIKEKDTSPAAKGEPTPETPELKALREQRDKLKEQYEQMKKDAMPPKDPEASRLKAFKTRTANRIAELERKLATGDFEKKPRNPIKLDPEAMKAKETAERLKGKVEEEIEKQRMKNRTMPEKTRDAILSFRRFVLLAGVKVLGKLTLAAGSRFGITPAESLIGNILELVPPIKKIGAIAHREGGGFKVSAEVEGVKQLWQKESVNDVFKIWKDGMSQLDALYGKHKVAESPTVLNSMGRMHKILKNIAHRSEFYRSFDIIADSYEKQGHDVTDPLIQNMIASESYIEANRAIMMNDNLITSLVKTAYKQGEVRGGSYAKLVVALAKVEFPIIKVPTNFADEVLSYTAGGLRSIPGLSKAALKGIDKLSPKEADYILRNLKKNSLSALMATAVFSGVINITFGGYFQKGEKRTPGDLGPGEWAINGHKMPMWAGHIPLLESMQVYQTVKDTSEALRLRGEGPVSRYSQGILQGAYGMSEHIPFIGTTSRDLESFATPEGRQKWFSQLAASMIIPPDIGSLAQYMDNDTPRTPSTTAEAFKNKIPGMRGDVPLNEKKIKREIAGKLRKDEDLTPYQQQEWDSLSQTQQDEIKKESEMTPLEVAFKGMIDPHLDKSIRAWGNLSDDEREEVRDVYEGRIKRYIDNHELTDEQLEKLNERIEAAEERKK